jgi:hypothetical protein
MRNAKIDAFLTEVQKLPGFVKASASDPKWLERFDAMARGLATVDREADNNPAMLDTLDKIQDVIGRADLSLKERLLEVAKLLTEVRDTLKITH